MLVFHLNLNDLTNECKLILTSIQYKELVDIIELNKNTNSPNNLFELDSIVNIF